MTTPTITQGSLLLLKTQVMADVPEGGGAVTGDVIADGGSNTIFPDISDLDRAIGAAKLRQIAVAVRTLGNPVYMGANLIIAQPPADPRVSVTLFAARPFERRAEAVSRVESYLTTGPEFAGYLLENHLQDQRSVQLFTRENADLPLIGQTLVLLYKEGTPEQRQQYVRVISVAATVREFTTTDSSGNPVEFKAKVVTCEISDALRSNFPGSPPSRMFARAANATQVRETTVADAGVYASTSPLSQPADLGDFTVRVGSIFTQLVPSAQTPVAMADIRTNGLSGALVLTGNAVTLNTYAELHLGQPLYLGGPVYPGTLAIVRDGVTLHDSGEALMQGDVQVGTFNHEAGLASLSANVWGTSAGTFAITFKPAALPDLVQDNFLIRVTAETSSRAYAFVLPNLPLAGTLKISFLTQGRWYSLSDDGSGALRASDASHGVGTLSSFGGVSLTLGALPDVGSVIMVSFAKDTSANSTSDTELLHGGRLFAPLNTSGQLSEERGALAIKQNGLILNWEDADGEPQTATDNGLGVLTGDAVGRVDYGAGVVHWSPNALPPSGTVVLMSVNGAAPVTLPGVALQGGNLGVTGIEPGSVLISLSADMTYTSAGAAWGIRNAAVIITDRAGVLFLRAAADASTANVPCGTVDYETGAIDIPTPLALDPGANGPVKTEIMGSAGFLLGYKDSYWADAPAPRTRSIALPASASVTCLAASAAVANTSVTVTAFFARTLALPSKRLRGVSFGVGTGSGAARYQQLADDSLVRDISPTTGAGTPAGTVTAGLSVVSVLSWPVGQSPVLTNWRGVLTAPAQGVESAFTGFSTVFRIPSVPLQSGSFSVQLRMQDGTLVSVSAGSNGLIDHPRIKGFVNHQYGWGELYGVNPDGAPELAVDLSHLGIAGLTTIPADLIMLDSLRYSAVSLSYIPLDAALIGIDPVRLPSDGRVPIFRRGGVAVVGHTGSVTANVSNDQTINCARVRLSHAQVLGADGLVINTGYSADLEDGLVTFADVTGYAQPVTIRHRIEDMAVVSEVNIDGQISFTRPLTHDYPLGSYVSSAIMGSEIGSNLVARVSLVFDQATWNGTTWADALVGSAATGTYNHAQYPITTTNAGAVTERFAVRFLNSTTFEVIGENLGVVGGGNTAEDFVLLDPVTGQTRLRIPALGWGLGWAAGNVLRINTVDAMLRAWALMTVLQGPATVPDDSWYLLARGSVDTP